MTIPQALQHLVVSDPEIAGGEPCFESTRVPLETVVDNLAGGHSIEHIEAVLHWERDLGRQAVGPKTRAS